MQTCKAEDCQNTTLSQCSVCKGWVCIEHRYPRQKHDCIANIKKEPQPTKDSLPFI